MPVQLYANNVTALVGAQVLSGATSITLQSGHGSRFPSPSGGDWFLATLYGYSGQTEVNHEIVKVTARSGDVLTVTRAQESTTARQWEVAAPIEMRMTAGSFPVTSVAGKVGAVTLASVDITNTPSGNLAAVTVQAALNELQSDIDSRALTSTLSGHTSATSGAHGISAFGATLIDDADAAAARATIGLGNVTNESKATMFASPTFTGTVSGITATMVGLGNVTNESKATMFTNPTFTGTVSGVTATHVGLGNVTNESKATMFTSPTFTGTATIGAAGFGNNAISGLKSASFNGQYTHGTTSGALTGGSKIDFTNGQKIKLTLTGNVTSMDVPTFPGVGHYQLFLVSGAYSVTWPTIGASWQWLNSAGAPTLNTGTYGGLVNIYYDGTIAIASYSKVGAS